MEDKEIRDAFERIWKYGINQLRDELKQTERRLNARFAQLESVRRWRIVQFLTSIGLGLTIVTILLTHR
jgi:hypothetical protein